MTDDNGWEYNLVHTDRLGSPAGPQLALIWKRQYSDGTTDWDQISKLGREGWEMVSAFPVESNGTLLYLAFMFKRRIPPAGATDERPPATTEHEAGAPPESAGDDEPGERTPGSADTAAT